MLAVTMASAPPAPLAFTTALCPGLCSVWFQLSFPLPLISFFLIIVLKFRLESDSVYIKNFLKTINGSIILVRLLLTLKVCCVLKKMKEKSNYQIFI
jgi:hypothetical protein